MNIKILSSLTSVTKKRNDMLTIGTHNGIFHADEVVACAILCLINSNSSVQILRSRDYEMLKYCDLCVDIGGGIFDHHQAGFDKTRENGIKYASAGLVWKSYGKQLIVNLGEKYFSELSFDSNYIFQTFDNHFISLVDGEDNGISAQTHCFSFVSSFLPLWFNNGIENFNNQFYKALLTTITVLEEELKTLIGTEAAKNIIMNKWNDDNFFANGIL